MSIEIKEIEKDKTYTVNGKAVYRDMEQHWVAPEALDAQELKAFRHHTNGGIVSADSNLKTNKMKSTINTEEIINKVVKILDVPVHKPTIAEHHGFHMVSVNYEGELNDVQLSGLTELGIPSIKRSGAGLSIKIQIKTTNP
ncbi:hypothetical protein R1T16_17350 [Flavobacterium sp. DG1-102-2]|uniref:hypothetical protein n=1 Tax=Flavobacterium sp. DG1-102-2 TaxID=3081663 RepID=UPI00294A6314|nr:hypothetical protein [Flavobacterium sp. DG1-102-2]MDV6170206.1 hypothetical protein [Flavobacterium sp. DG1-102-2]